MNILQVSRTYYPAIGGIESVTGGLSRALAQLGHRCDVLTLRYIFDRRSFAPPTERHQGLQIYRLPHLGGRRYPIAPGALAFASRYDVLHLHAIDFFVDYLSLTAPAHRRPIVVNTHGGIFHTRWLAPLKRLWFATITRLSLRRASAVICDSEHDYELFRHIVSPEKLHVIRNGVDVTPFMAINKQVTPGLLVGVGRIVENKRVDRLITLLARLSESAPAAHLVWVGDDANGQAPALMARARELGVAERVELAGQLSEPALHSLLARANLFVSTADYEAFGVSTIEAMASGTVPVVTPVGIHPQIVSDGLAGFLLPADEEAAAAVIRHALQLSPAALERSGAAARAAARRYSWEQAVDEYVRVYQSAVSGA
jgi:alpha-1,3-mannosyltransferase